MLKLLLNYHCDVVVKLCSTLSLSPLAPHVFVERGGQQYSFHTCLYCSLSWKKHGWEFGCNKAACSSSAISLGQPKRSGVQHNPLSDIFLWVTKCQRCFFFVLCSPLHVVVTKWTPTAYCMGQLISMQKRCIIKQDTRSSCEKKIIFNYVRMFWGGQLSLTQKSEGENFTLYKRKCSSNFFKEIKWVRTFPWRNSRLNPRCFQECLILHLFITSVLHELFNRKLIVFY